MFCLVGLTTALTVACRNNPPAGTATPSTQPASQPIASSVAPPTAPESPASQPTAPSPKVNSFELGLDKAASATSITSTAQSAEDWNLAADQWRQAIDLMKRLPSSSPYQVLAKSKIPEYQRQLSFAQKQASRLSQAPRSLPLASSPATITVQTSDNARSPAGQAIARDQVYRVRIKRREGNTPVIDVTFNGRYRFEMIVDTGASATVITQQMASAMGVVPVDTATVDTASAKNVQVPVGFVDSVEAGGLTANNVAVMIANSELDIGLLGHNFFGEYDVTIKRDVVEFRVR
ncbi:hypothetical protein BST81_23490 [Leptolyngbya sp. 'hensonii']|nr:hypothetical protein BST81_23490 [Leptolyngbya sp. 'hensonii']